MADQSLPCSLSHAGLSCHANALGLYRKFFMVVPPSIVTSQAVMAVLLGRKFSADRVLRLIAFVFGSSGLPGLPSLVASGIGRGLDRGTT